jgi:hypothetical protein
MARTMCTGATGSLGGGTPAGAQKSGMAQIKSTLHEIDAGLTRLGTALATLPRRPTLTEMAEAEARRHPNVIFSVNEEAGTVQAVIAPHSSPNADVEDPRLRLNEVERSRRDAELAALDAIAGDPRSAPHARKAAAVKAASIRQTLAKTRSA